MLQHHHDCVAEASPPPAATVSTPFGYGAVRSTHHERASDVHHHRQQQQHHTNTHNGDTAPSSIDTPGRSDSTSSSPTSAESGGFTCVEFPWGRAFLHTELAVTTPVFTFYAVSKAERIKFALPFALTSPGADMVAAVRRELALSDDVAITLVQTDSVSKHEIAPDKPIGACTIGADAKHPILVLQAPLVRLDPNRCARCLALQESNAAVVQVANGYGTVLGNCEIASGVKYWEVELQSATGGDGVFLGVAAADLLLNNSVLNRSAFWGIECRTGHKAHDTIDYYTEPFVDGDVVGVLLDMAYGRLSFYRNGKYLGVAYRGIALKTLSPALSLTSVGQRLMLLSTSTAPLA